MYKRLVFLLVLIFGIFISGSIVRANMSIYELDMKEILNNFNRVDSITILSEDSKQLADILVLDTDTNTFKVLPVKAKLLEKYEVVGYIINNTLYTGYTTHFEKLLEEHSNYIDYIKYGSKLTDDLSSEIVFKSYFVLFISIIFAIFTALVIVRIVDDCPSVYLDESLIVTLLISISIASCVVYTFIFSSITNINLSFNTLIKKEVKISNIEKYIGDIDEFKKYR